MSTKKLIAYGPFRVVLFIGVFIFSISFISLLITEVLEHNSTLCVSKECFVNFVSIFNFPIDVVKGTVALLALIALLHKSEETQHQIKISEAQNVFNNYYHHRRMVFEELSDITKKNEFVKLDDLNKLYSSAFPLNSPVNFIPVSDLVNVRQTINCFFKGVFSEDYFKNIQCVDAYNISLFREFEKFTLIDKSNFIENFELNLKIMLDSLGLGLCCENYKFSDEIINDTEKSWLVVQGIYISKNSEILNIDFLKILDEIDSLMATLNRIANCHDELSFTLVGLMFFEKITDVNGIRRVFYDLNRSRKQFASFIFDSSNVTEIS